jgi:hypothetical protein
MSMSWTRLGVAVEVSSWVTRAQSLVSPTAPPAGSHGKVEANVRTLSCQIASVGRRSTVPTGKTLVAGWIGLGGSSKAATMPRLVRSRGPAKDVPPPAFVPVIRM